MSVKKILTTNVKNFDPAYSGEHVFFQRSDSKGKNGLTRYGKPQGSMTRQGQCLTTVRHCIP